MTTLPGRLVHWAQTRPDAVALRRKRLGVWEEITWRDYLGRVAATARVLDAWGVGPGDHVAILSDNRPEWLYADLAAQALGARSVGIYQTNPAADVGWALDHSHSRVLFCEDQEQVDKAVEVAGQTPSVDKVVVFDPKGTRGYEDPRLVRWDDLDATGDPAWLAERVAALDPRAPAMVVYTSGTTGTPKGAMLSSRNALAYAGTLTDLMGLTDTDSLLSYLPLCHVAEKIFSLFLPLSVGAVVHFGESIATVQQDLREVSPTVFLGVPRIWEKMHAGVTLRMRDSSWLKRTLFHLAERGAPGSDLLVLRPLQERLGLRRCRLAVSGAAPISVDLLRWYHQMGICVLEGYGQTECAGVSHLNPPGRFRLGSVGIAIPGTECRIAEDGEVLVRGEHVFVGYLHDEAATREVLDEEGWLHTGDVGEVDADGFLFITGRKKEILITAGGKNLSPERIENALKTSPYIKEAVAVGDRRRFVSALIQVDAEAVGDQVGRMGVVYGDFEDLTRRPEVRDLVAAEVERANELLARVEQVRAFRLFPKELHQDDGELTATQKVRRKAVHERWGDLIEEMYR